MALSAGLIILALSLWVFLGLLPLRVLLHWLSIAPPHRALQLSLGFVLGAAVTAAAFMVGSEHPRLIALGVAAASLSAAWYCFYLGSKSKEHFWRDDTGLAAYNTYSALGVIFAVLLCLHLALILAENLTRSVYPWDAWTTWIYRSKLWFFNGEIAPLLPPALWLSEGGPTQGTIAAHEYPAFISLIALYPSSLANEWSDHWVNLPWGLCAVALAAGVFGLCRELKISSTAALFAALALFSAPLLHIHFAMAGYADAWMTATTGLGLACCLGWAHKRQTNVLVCGVIFLLLGAFIKREGVPWLGLALIWLAAWEIIRHYPIRAALCSALIVTGIGGLLLSNGLLPLGPLGQLGISDQQLFLGPLGSFALANQAVLGVYQASFMTQGNWQLLILLWVFSCCVLAKRNGALVVASLSLVTLFWFSQYAIFRFTQLGDFAVSGTAINRLFLHLLPALAVTIGAGFHQLSAEHDDGLHRYRTWLVGVGFAGVLVVGVVCMMVFVNAGSTRTPTQRFDQSNLQAFAGQVSWLERGFQLKPTGEGVAAAGRRGNVLMAADFPYVRIVLNQAPKSLSFFWRRQDTPGDFHTLPVTAKQTLLALHQNSAWRGSVVIEYGLVQGGEPTPLPIVHDVSLLTSASFSDVATLMSRWLAPKPHNYQSINFLSADAADTWPSSNSAVIAAAVLIMGLLLILRASRSATLNGYGPVAGLSVAALLGLFLLGEAIALNGHTARLPMNTSGVYTPANKPVELAQRLKPHIPAATPLLIFPASPAQSFQALRLAYDLLPLPAYAVLPELDLSTTKFPKDWPGLGLLLDNPANLPNTLNRLQASSLGNAEPLQAGEDWMLFQGPGYPSRNDRLPSLQTKRAGARE